MPTFDDQSASLIRLDNGTILYLREINKFLAIVCILREFNMSRRGTIDYNFLCFHEAIHKIFAVRLSKKCVTLTNHIYDADDEDRRSDQSTDNEDEDEDDDIQPCDIRSSSQLEKYLTYIRSGARIED